MAKRFGSLFHRGRELPSVPESQDLLLSESYEWFAASSVDATALSIRLVGCRGSAGEATVQMVEMQ